jgi:hypothetical protein
MTTNTGSELTGVDREWFVLLGEVDSGEVGPFDSSEIRRRAATGQIHPITLVRQRTAAKPVRAFEVVGLGFGPVFDEREWENVDEVGGPPWSWLSQAIRAEVLCGSYSMVISGEEGLEDGVSSSMLFMPDDFLDRRGLLVAFWAFAAATKQGDQKLLVPLLQVPQLVAFDYGWNYLPLIRWVTAEALPKMGSALTPNFGDNSFSFESEDKVFLLQARWCDAGYFLIWCWMFEPHHGFGREGRWLDQEFSDVFRRSLVLE